MHNVETGPDLLYDGKQIIQNQQLAKYSNLFIIEKRFLANKFWITKKMVLELCVFSLHK